jgi:hypothetical protein
MPSPTNLGFTRDWQHRVRKSAIADLRETRASAAPQGEGSQAVPADISAGTMLRIFARLQMPTRPYRCCRPAAMMLGSRCSRSCTRKAFAPSGLASVRISSPEFSSACWNSLVLMICAVASAS